MDDLALAHLEEVNDQLQKVRDARVTAGDF
jgi:hypothetical protein